MGPGLIYQDPEIKLRPFDLKKGACPLKYDAQVPFFIVPDYPVYLNHKLI